MIKTTINKFIIIFVISILFSSNIYSQIRIKQLPTYNLSNVDSLFFDINEIRKIIPLNSDWSIYPEEYPENKTKVVVPSSFTGEQVMIYERELNLTQKQITDNHIYLNFFGLNYHSEILFNDLSISRHSSDGLPFSVELPKDLFNFQSKNKITVKISSRLDSRNTIPLKQRFLFPPNIGGLVRDVYLSLVPNEGISNFSVKFQLNEKFSKAELNFNFEFASKKNSEPDTLEHTYKYYIKIFDNSGNLVDSIRTKKIDFKENSKFEDNASYQLSSPKLWSPSSPNFYKCRISLLKDDKIIDATTKVLSISNLVYNKDSIRLNDEEIELNGVTYIQFNIKNETLVTFNELESDFRTIKNIGFNSVRFAKEHPHPYALYLCQKFGLFAFIDLPLDSVPEEFASSTDFSERASGYLKQLIASYKNFSSVIGFGLGSGYLADSEIHADFISSLASEVKNSGSKITYASFKGVPKGDIDSLDLIGLELFTESPALYESNIEDLASLIGRKRVFISEASYPVFNGSSSGYLHEFSSEAQAKYFEDLIEFSKTKNLGGFFISTLNNYKGDFYSLSLSFNREKLYKVGIINREKNTNVISYKVLQSKLNNGERVTVPIGSKTDDSPLLFIVFGLFLAVAMGILINSKRKFREDATRALLRPYNFFADIRDHRILSGVHSSLLLIIILGSHALLLTNLFFFFKDNVLVEKILLSFGSPNLLFIAGYLAWNPAQALFYLMIFSILLFILITASFKLASFFARQKVFYSNIYFVVIWAILPLAILLPVELVLYRVLITGSFNNYIFIFLGLYGFWIFQRIMKGIYVIFDVRAITVYFYTMVSLLLIAGGIILYYHLTESTVYYIINSVKQYQLMKL